MLNWLEFLLACWWNIKHQGLLECSVSPLFWKHSSNCLQYPFACITCWVLFCKYLFNRYGYGRGLQIRNVVQEVYLFNGWNASLSGSLLIVLFNRIENCDCIDSTLGVIGRFLFFNLQSEKQKFYQDCYNVGPLRGQWGRGRCLRDWASRHSHPWALDENFSPSHGMITLPILAPNTTHWNLSLCLEITWEHHTDS